MPDAAIGGWQLFIVAGDRIAEVGKVDLVLQGFRVLRAPVIWLFLNLLKLFGLGALIEFAVPKLLIYALWLDRALFAKVFGEIL